ncbi:MAG: coenzyme F420-0:L-glutamate ligase [Nitrososphaerales archaeon]|jgi:coenzyme F420-0:L-glutamate ligase
MLTFTPFKTTRRSSAFDLPDLVDELVGNQVGEGDVLVISSKFIAISEGRIVSLDSVKPGSRAIELSRKFEVPAELCELILQESDLIIGGVPGFILTLWNGLLTPNAGIDKSNIEHGRVVLYPKDPCESAARIADELRKRRGVHIGVVVSDSRLTPTRMGTVGVALAAVGVQAIRDMRGHPDLFGNPLKVTRQAIADDLCSGAQLVMGEADEATPVVLVRGVQTAGAERASFAPKDFAIPIEQCVFMGSVGYPKGEGALDG